MKNKIIKFLSIPLLVCVLLCFAACGGQNTPSAEPSPTVQPRSDAMKIPEGAIGFNVKNSIGGDIYEMRISPNSLEQYGEDILENILPRDASADVYFIPCDTYEYWDLRVLTENGNIYTWQNVKFGTFDAIELMINDNGPEFSVR